MNSRLDTYEQTISMLRAEKGKLEKELETAGSQLENAENRSYALEHQLQQYIQVIKEKEAEMSSLGNVIKDLRMRLRVYVPTKVSAKGSHGHRETPLMGSWRNSLTACRTQEASARSSPGKARAFIGSERSASLLRSSRRRSSVIHGDI